MIARVSSFFFARRLRLIVARVFSARRSGLLPFLCTFESALFPQSAGNAGSDSLLNSHPGLIHRL
jgi:hypothetical protein